MKPKSSRRPVRPNMCRRSRESNAASRIEKGMAMPTIVRKPGKTRSARVRSEEHTSELQSLMRISYAVFCLKKKNKLQSYKNNVSSIEIEQKPFTKKYASSEHWIVSKNDRKLYMKYR